MATPVLNDSALVAADATFQARVKAALIETCNNIAAEATTGFAGTMPIQLHVLRARLAALILNNINSNSPTGAGPLTFASAVATDPTSIAAATVNGNLTSGTAAAGAAAIPDSDILTAISAMFNNFLTLV